MADVEASVDIEVDGAEELQAAAEAASRLADEIEKAEAAAGELSAGAGSIEDLSGALESAAATAEEFSRAADTARDALLGLGAAGSDVDAVSAELSAGADMAEAFAEGVRQARDDLAELDAAGEGTEAIAAGLLEDAAAARAFAENLGAARDNMGELAGEGGIVTLTQELHNAGAGMYDFETGASDAALAAQALGLGATDAEMGLEDIEGAASDAEGALGGGGGGGLSSVLGAVTDGFSELGGVISGLPNIPDWLKTGAMWTGIATLIGGGISTLAPLAAGVTGFAALAAPALYKVYEGWEQVSQARQQYQEAVATYKGDPTAANLQAEQKALDTLNASWREMPKGIDPTIAAVKQLWSQLQKASVKSGVQKDLFADMPKAVRDIEGLIGPAEELSKAFSPEIGRALGDFKNFEVSPGFKNFIHDLAGDVRPAAHAVHELASAGGQLVHSLVAPKNEKDFDSMWTGLAKGLKAITPGAVHELGEIATQIGKIGGEIQKVQSSGTGHTIGRLFDDLMDIPSAALRGGGAIAKAMTGFTEYMIQASGKDNAQRSQLWEKYFGGSSAAATKAGNEAGKDYRDALNETLAVKEKGHQDLLGGNTRQDAEKQAKEVADATAQAVRQSGSSSQLRSALSDAASKAAQNVKIHGATVDLANAKLSGLTQLQAVLQRAGQQAGKDYDTALAHGIEDSAQVAVTASKTLGTDAKTALDQLRSEFEQIGEQAAQGLAAGIREGTPDAVAAAQSMAQAVENAARVSLQTHSPSLVFDEIGQNIDAGLTQGIEAQQGQPVSAIDQMMDQMIAAAKAGGKSLQAEIKSQIAQAQNIAKSVKAGALSYASLSSIEGQGIGQGKNDKYPTLQVGMEVKLANIQHFYEQIKKLKKEGLSEALIKQIVAAGPQAGEEMAKQLLATGKHGIHHADRLEREIEKWSGMLGRESGNAATEPYKYIAQPIASALKGALHNVKVDGHVDVHNEVHVKVELDGREIANSVQTHTLARANRGPSSGLKLKTRGS